MPINRGILRSTTQESDFEVEVDITDDTFSETRNGHVSWQQKKASGGRKKGWFRRTNIIVLVFLILISITLVLVFTLALKKDSKYFLDQSGLQFILLSLFLSS
ncbi:uncharacterized protein [Clytia hemisphaerica]|uniref:uncharacterized protein n=1 Tax=Clytia hemisphaerica TaxID=252671 RepID=UPI0034D68C15